MEIVEIRCGNCGKIIYIDKNHAREEMFCTLGCMEKGMNRMKNTEQDARNNYICNI